MGAVLPVPAAFPLGRCSASRIGDSPPAKGRLGRVRDRVVASVSEITCSRRTSPRATRCGPSSAYRRSRRYEDQWRKADRFIAFTAEPYEYHRSGLAAERAARRAVDVGAGGGSAGVAPRGDPTDRARNGVDLVSSATRSSSARRSKRSRARTCCWWRRRRPPIRRTFTAPSQRADRAVPAAPPDHRSRRVRDLPRRPGHRRRSRWPRAFRCASFRSAATSSTSRDAWSTRAPA